MRVRSSGKPIDIRCLLSMAVGTERETREKKETKCGTSIFKSYPCRNFTTMRNRKGTFNMHEEPELGLPRSLAGVDAKHSNGGSLV